RGADDKWGRSKLINQRNTKNLPPEPVRFIGANIVRAALVRKGKAEIQDRKPGSLTEAVVKLMPKGTTEHS
ncbi:amine oxidase, partial [Arthrobacter deserti]|nr:amine oxidase [Arthrobacter deserti]